jgi:hypothetical protein
VPENCSADRLVRALEAVDLACHELAGEAELLDAEREPSRASAGSVVRLLLRGIPDLCSILAPHLRDLPSVGVAKVLDRCFSRAPFDDERMSDRIPRLREHLDAYAASLTRWEGWDPTTLEVDEFDSPVAAVRWVTAWERRDDLAVAADLVGYVKDPEDLDKPSDPYTAFARDAHAACQRCLNEYGDDRVKGVRLWIVGADERPVVRWLTPR